MLVWLKLNREGLINSSLFFVVVLISFSYKFVPLFSIPFYPDSSVFVWLISQRLDYILILWVFYYKTYIPKSFKRLLMACSFLACYQLIDLLPFDNNSASFFHFALSIGFSFSISWGGVILSQRYYEKGYLRDLEFQTHSDSLNNLQEQVDAVKDLGIYVL